MATIATRMKDGCNIKEHGLTVSYKTANTLHRDLAVAALWLAIVVLTINMWGDNGGVLAFEGTAGVVLLLIKYRTYANRKYKIAFVFTSEGISNTWGIFKWAHIYNVLIDNKHYFKFTAMAPGQSEKVFSYDMRELDIDRKHLEDLAASHQNKTPQL